MKISGGSVDFIARRSQVYVYKAATQSINPLAWTPIDLDTIVYDVWGDFNIGTYQFTAPEPGKYLVVGAVGVSGLADGKYCEVSAWKNDAVYLGIVMVYAGASGGLWLPSISIVELAQGDTVKLYVQHNDTVARNIDQNKSSTYLQIMRIK